MRQEVKNNYDVEMRERSILKKVGSGHVAR